MHTESDYNALGRTLFSREMSDNLLVEAGISNIVPNDGVVFLSSVFQSALSPSNDRYNEAVERGHPFVYDTTPYEMLVDATEMFPFIPTIAFPVYISLHWGYVVVSPDSLSLSATVMWGDSLRYNPPKGLLETFRAYLLLIFRGIKISISRTNHALDVLNFAAQQDGYSCGFYVVAAMKSFGRQGTHGTIPGMDEEFPSELFHSYDSRITERYRESCIRVLVRHLLLIAFHGRPVLCIEVFRSMRRNARMILERCVDAPMYENVPAESRVLLGREHTCVKTTLESTANTEGTPDIASSTSGLLSMFTASIPEPRPLVRTLPLPEPSGNVAFADIVDLSTVFVCENHPDGASTLANTESNGDWDLQGPQNLSRSSAEARESSPDADPWTHAYDSTNLFAEIAQRSVEGRLLRKPDYSENKGTGFFFRLRLCCRLYEPPPKWKKTDLVPRYQRCQARLYARLYRSGGWRITFRYKRNHRIWTDAYLEKGEVRKRLLALLNSLSPYYPGAAKEHTAWLRGARSVGEPCPAVPGTWDDTKDASTEDEEKNTTKSGTGTSSYTDIAPRTESGCNPTVLPQLVTQLDTPGMPFAEPRIGVREREELITVSLEVREILSKYVQGCVATMPGRTLKDELKHICECFGFSMQVRDSEYIKDRSEPSSERGPPQVKRMMFRCPVGEDTKLRKTCQHRFSVISANTEYMKGKADGTVNKSDECVARPFVVKFSQVWHNHGADDDSLKKCLPTQIWQEAMQMKDKSLIRTGDIVRYIEDTYQISLDRAVFARRLRHEMNKRHPAEKDCHRLVANLLSLGEQNPGMFSKVRVVDENVLHSVCWGFPKWREE